MRYERDLQQWNFDAPRDSKLSNILIIVYMCTVLLFTSHDSLNIISLSVFVIAFGYCCFYMFMHGKFLVINKFLVILTSFLVFCFFSLLWTSDFDESIKRLITIFRLFVVCYILCSYISNYDNIDTFILGLLVSGTICCFVVIGYYGFSEYLELMEQGVRLGGPIANENTIGLYAATTVLVAFYYGFYKDKKIGYLFVFIPALVTFGTGSRKALVMIVIGVLLLVMMKYKESINLKSVAKFLGILLASVLILNWLSEVPLFGTTFERLGYLLNNESGKMDNSAETRMRMIEIGLDYFKKHPFTGIGLGNTKIITWMQLGWQTYLHNNYVELLASVGIFGFMLYYCMYAYLLISLYRISASTKYPPAALMFVIILANLILEYGFVSYYNKMTYVYLAMAAGTVVIGNRKMAEMEFYEDDEEDFEGIEEPEGAPQDNYR